MKWFKLDSDMPDDPKIRVVTRALGVEGLGALLGTYCHVAKHGARPGHGIDSRGVPFPVEDVQAASGLPADKFAELMELCTRTGHFQRETWELYRGIYIPAMERRADTYAQKLARSQQLTIKWPER